MAKKSPTKKASGAAPKTDTKRVPGTSKLDTLLKLLRRPTGASIDDLVRATGWQKHSVRGALAGSLKKKGHVTTSELVDGVRRYRVAETQR
jgi:hypothetical protein